MVQLGLNPASTDAESKDNKNGKDPPTFGLADEEDLLAFLGLTLQLLKWV